VIADHDDLIRSFTSVQPVPTLPEVRLYLATELVPLWQAVEQRRGVPQPPPFWAFAWPGSLALGRYLTEQPSVVGGKSVLDFGSGSGLAAIVAVRLGASGVTAADIDPLAATAQRLNAALNEVSFEIELGDLVGQPLRQQVVLAGDVCYERTESERILSWLRGLAGQGTEVLLADPGRHYAPTDGLELLATYEVPTLMELESQPTRRTRLWRLLPPQTSVFSR
jgi:predicted nicotinamide N-methyase